jgi:putative hydrolase of the HAD superfamily
MAFVVELDGMKTYKSIFFDVDGVLVKSKFLFTEQLERDFGMKIETMLPFFTGLFRQCSVGKADLKVELAKVIGDWGWKGTVDELLAYWFSKGTQIDQEVVDYVMELKEQGVQCFMATDQERYRGEHLERELGGGRVFERVFYSAGVGCSKKEQAFWDYAFEQIASQPSDSLFIDDDSEKVEAVAKFGLDTYLYTDLPSLKTWMNS